MKKRNDRRGKRATVDGDERLFAAEAAYADSIVRTGMGDFEGATQALRLALTFVPEYAPAIFSLGTVEYQRGRRKEGRRLFHSLLSQPRDTADLFGLIDHAGDFLIALGDYEHGLELYATAVRRFPDIAVFHQGMGCCAGNEGLFDEAIEASRRALALEPGNQQFMNDLGWSLLEGGRLSEAEEALSRAVAMNPSDQLAAENLRFCKAELAKPARATATPNKRLQPTAAAKRRRRG